MEEGCSIPGAKVTENCYITWNHGKNWSPIDATTHGRRSSCEYDECDRVNVKQGADNDDEEEEDEKVVVENGFSASVQIHLTHTEYDDPVPGY